MFSSRRKYKSKIIGGFMSGDAGLHHNEQEVIFYDKKMTKTKMVLLSLKGIKFNITTEEESEECEWNSMTN